MGIWKSFDELEESISLDELNMIIKKKREREYNEMKFAAGLKGIDLDKDEESPVQKRIEETKRRAAVRLKGEEEVQRAEFADLGFGYQTV